MSYLEDLRAELREAENSLLLNIDGSNIDQTKIPEIYGPYIKKVKWGVAIPHSHMASLWRTALARDGISIFYDSKLSERSPQIPKSIHILQEWGYDRVSISAAGASVKAMVQAGMAATDTRLVVDISPDDAADLQGQLIKIDQANAQLPEQRRLNWLICDANNITEVRKQGDWIISATGIYIPGTNPPDVDNRFTPEEARRAGADEIAIGSSINFALDLTPEQAVGAALANLALAR